MRIAVLGGGTALLPMLCLALLPTWLLVTGRPEMELPKPAAAPPKPGPAAPERGPAAPEPGPAAPESSPA